MSNQKYFDVPWATGGDKTTVPDPLQSSGSVSFTEGWNYNYQRDLATDPLALPIDRATTNYLFNTITAAIAAIQSETVPEFILASQNGGTAIAYGAQAVVLYSASGNAPFTKFVNITGAANSQTPSVSDPLGATTGWQIACDPIATNAQASAGTNNASIMTPLLVAQQTALRALLAGSATQVFNVGPATALTHATEAGQVQDAAFNYAGLAGGTANAITATLSPVPPAYSDYLVAVVRVASNNTGSVTFNLNALGAKVVIGGAHSTLQGGELVAGGFAAFAYSTNFSECILLWATGGAEQIGNATQSQQALPLGQANSLYAPIGTQLHGQCRLSVTSTTQIALKPYNGNNLIINGTEQQIPSAGVTLANTGLAANTLYYVYAYMNAGVMTLEAVTTTHTTSAINGVEIKSADATRTLVGMLNTNASSQFVDSTTSITLRNWFNRPGRYGASPTQNPSSTQGSSLQELSTGLRIPFLVWSDEVATISLVGTCQNNTAGGGCLHSAGVDGAASGPTTSFYSYAAGVTGTCWASYPANLSEGLHTASGFGEVSTGQGNWTIGTQVLIVRG